MKILLTVQETLIWHDTPLLFVAKDPVGGLHLGLAVEDTDEGLPRYVAVAISPLRLLALKSRKLDLHGVFAKPELGAWSQIAFYGEDHVVAEPLLVEELPKEWLPKPGELLPVLSGDGYATLRHESFEMVKVAAVAREANMNPTLLRQYLSGVKKPSLEQAHRVVDALHRVAGRLLEVRPT